MFVSGVCSALISHRKKLVLIILVWFSSINISSAANSLTQQTEVMGMVASNLDLKWVTVIAVFFMALFFIALYFFRAKKTEQLEFKFGTNKFNFYFRMVVFIFVITILVTGWFGIKINKQGFLLKTQSTLQSVRDTTIDGLNLWLKNKHLILGHVSQDQQFIDLVERLLKVSSDKKSIQLSDALNDIRRFHYQKKDFLGDMGFFIINKENISIGSMRDTNLGTINLIALQRGDLLKRVFKGESVLIPPIYSDVHLNSVSNTKLKPPTMFIATPVKNKAGKVIAVFAIRLDPNKQFSQILRTGRIGKTGETYAIDRKGLLISNSHFENELYEVGLLSKGKTSVLSLRVTDPEVELAKGVISLIPYEQQSLTKMATSVLQGLSKVDTEGYRDYRGVRVFGAWSWLPELGIGLVTEIDESEALDAYYISRNIILMILAVVLLGTVSTLVFTLTMANRTNRILQRSRDELESKVLERTEELRTKEANFKEILDASPIAVIMTSQAGVIQYVNDMAAGIMEYKNKFLLNKQFNDFFVDSSSYEVLINKLKDEELVHNEEIKLKRADHIECWQLMSLIPTVYEDKSVILFWFADITNRKEYEANLAEAKELAEQANKAKTEFLSSMSHELRTPLNAVIGFSQIIEMDVVDPEMKDNVVEILKAGNHLLALIDDILDFSSIEAGKLHISMEEVLLIDVIKECTALITFIAEEKGLQVILPTEKDCQFSVLADYMRLKQVFLNLLSNAIKYNKEDGTITLNCEMKQPGTIRITVTDTGVGLSASDQKRLFQAFNRLGVENSNIVGSGVGLVITERLVGMMGGEIGVTSELGEGSSFWIELKGESVVNLKTDEPENKALKINFESSLHSNRKSILYVEDNPANLRLVVKLIKQYSPYDLMSAHDGEQAVVIASTQKPDLILLDINLPKQDGFAVMTELQTNPETRHIPVVAVSANASTDYIEKANKAGFVDYVIKPIDVERLLNVIKDQI